MMQTLKGFKLPRPTRPRVKVKASATPPAEVDSKNTAQREPPAGLLKRLEFKVLRPLDGYLFGNYRGLFYGPSLDLAEVREYQPGDEVRRIDWNVTARTGTVHIRQYLEEREIIAWLIVDLSPSMNFGTRRVLKREEALEFAGVAASIITRQGNKVGALSFSPRGTKLTPLGTGRRQALRIVQDLQAQTFDGDGTGHNGTGHNGTKGDGSPVGRSAGATELAGTLAYANRTLRRRALVFVVSDFINSDFISSDSALTPDSEPAWGEELRRLAYRHDVIAVRVSDPAERVLPKVGDLRVRDPETGQELWLDTDDPRVRRAHACLVAERDEKIARTMRAARIDTLELSTERDIVQPLLKFTLRRQGRRA